MLSSYWRYTANTKVATSINDKVLGVSLVTGISQPQSVSQSVSQSIK